MTFTDKGIRALQYDTDPGRHFEGGSDKGFGVRVQKSKKTFFIQYKSPVTGGKRFFSLGDYGRITLEEAREACRVARKQVKDGLDPAIERDKVGEAERQRLEDERRRKEEAQRQAEIEAAIGTVDELFAAYFDAIARKGAKSLASRRKMYAKEVQPHIGSLKARDIVIDDAKTIIQGVYQRGAVRVADHVRDLLHAGFNYGLQADNDITRKTPASFHLNANPVSAIPKFYKQNPGERNLSGDEIRQLWAALDQSRMDHATACIIRLLLVTGQRVQEVVGMRWDELDLDANTWNMPGERTKNHRPHVIPLPSMALEIVASMEPLSSHTAYLFPGRDDDTKPIEWRSVTRALKRLCTTQGIEPVTPRDLRRTWKSRAGEAGLSKEIRDRLQNHAQHDVSAKHYDRFDYFDQKRKAMEQWAQWLLATIHGDEQADNVIQLKRG